MIKPKLANDSTTFSISFKKPFVWSHM